MSHDNYAWLKLKAENVNRDEKIYHSDNISLGTKDNCECSI